MVLAEDLKKMKIDERLVFFFNGKEGDEVEWVNKDGLRIVESIHNGSCVFLTDKVTVRSAKDFDTAVDSVYHFHYKKKVPKKDD